VTVVLDTSSILRHLDDEAGAARIDEVFRDCVAGDSRIVISSVQWGELTYILNQRQGPQSMQVALADLLEVGIEVVPATRDRAVRSGIIRATKKIPYADCFAIELAGDSQDHLLMTADFDFKTAENDVRIEFLPANPRPA